MEDSNSSSSVGSPNIRSPFADAGTKKSLLLRTSLWIGLAVALILGSVAWLSGTAATLKTELTAAENLLPKLKNEMLQKDVASAEETVKQLAAHTGAAKEAGSDPLWTAARLIPWLGVNFQVASEVATSADDVARHGAVPLVSVFRSLDWTLIIPDKDGIDIGQLSAAEPKISSAADAVWQSSERLNRIDPSALLPQVAEPLSRAGRQLDSLRVELDTAADAAKVGPAMMGAQAPRNYLLLIQNNAEARASGGIPGALAVLTLDKGKLTLSGQSSAARMGKMSPALPVDVTQQQIYSPRLGKYMQDVNLTPDFPTAASTAKAMWEKTTGQSIDGVISLDPVALSYILDATGPVKLTQPDLIALASRGLPTELDGQNVVETLLSDVYAKIQQPQLQDAYFAGVAQETFTALAGGQAEATGLIEGLIRGSEEGRILVWSGRTTEQSIIAGYSLSGAIAGPSVLPAQFGVYFNDGTGAKMDYYVKRSVQLIKECEKGGYEQTTVRVISSNIAPADSAVSLPEYVTGGGLFGVPAGSVQTNIVAYGPVQANIETAELDGQRFDFAAHLHSDRPVGVLAVRLAPGESKTVEFTFGKIVQHTEPNVVVTPTVQDVKDVILPIENAKCGS